MTDYSLAGKVALVTGGGSGIGEAACRALALAGAAVGVVDVREGPAVSVAEAIRGDSDRFKLFTPFGLAWNGGPFGTAAVQLTYWRYQAADFLRERRQASPRLD